MGSARHNAKAWCASAQCIAEPTLQRGNLPGAALHGLFITQLHRLNPATSTEPSYVDRRLVEVRHGQGERELIFLAGERSQAGSIVAELGPDHGIGPRADVESRRTASELLPCVRGEAEHAAGAGAVLVIHVVAAQR